MGLNKYTDIARPSIWEALLERMPRRSMKQAEVKSNVRYVYLPYPYEFSPASEEAENQKA